MSVGRLEQFAVIFSQRRTICGNTLGSVQEGGGGDEATIKHHQLTLSGSNFLLDPRP
jgi:hypothetical protein